MLLIALPAPIRGSTHLDLVWVDVKPESITAAFRVGAAELEKTAQGERWLFTEDADFRQPTVRSIDGEQLEGFLQWVASKGAEISPTYGPLFNVRDVMEFIGVMEYKRRGLPLPDGLQ